MSADDDEEASDGLHPRETQQLFGHAEAERILLEAYRGGRIPHAWLIGGPRGIGKATLAYRMARFVLAHPDPRQPGSAIRALACGRSGTSGGAAYGRAGARRPAGAGADRSTNAASCARTSRSMTCAARFRSSARPPGKGAGAIAIVDAVDELNDCRRQCAAENRRRAAAAYPAAVDQPCAGPGDADHPLALPRARFAAACRPARWRRPLRLRSAAMLTPR